MNGSVKEKGEFCHFHIILLVFVISCQLTLKTNISPIFSIISQYVHNFLRKTCFCLEVVKIAKISFSDMIWFQYPVKVEQTYLIGSSKNEWRWYFRKIVQNWQKIPALVLNSKYSIWSRWRAKKFFCVSYIKWS